MNKSNNKKDINKLSIILLIASMIMLLFSLLVMFKVSNDKKSSHLKQNQKWIETYLNTCESSEQFKNLGFSWTYKNDKYVMGYTLNKLDITMILSDKDTYESYKELFTSMELEINDHQYNASSTILDKNKIEYFKSENGKVIYSVNDKENF